MKQDQSNSNVDFYDVTDKNKDNIESKENIENSRASPTNKKILKDEEKTTVSKMNLIPASFNENDEKKSVSTKNNAIQTLLSELHHRVKNNLQIIGSLLSIQARRLEEPTAKHAIQDVQSRIRTMTLIHEKLYQTDLLTEVELDEYIIELQQFLFRLYQKENQIQAIITIPKVRINVDKAIPLGLILNEWITNSLKYAFPVSENKSVNIISISLQKKENQYSIIYQDNGIGMQKETQNNTIKSDTPTKKKKSMGTQLVASLVEQLNATQKEHFEEQGVCFELIIPS